MIYRNLTGTGLRVSPYCVGSDSFGANTEPAEALRILARAFEEGVNFIDTADSYADGASEEVVGRFIRSRRDEAVVCSKVYHPTGDHPNALGNGRKHIMAGVEASLKRLQTDHIDLYLLHYYDYDTPLEESVRAMEDLVQSGKARYAGCSNFSASQLAKAHWLADKGLNHRFRVNQVRYNLLNREPEIELLPACAELGVSVVAYSVQAGGMLLGKYFRDASGAFRSSDPDSRLADSGKERHFYRNAYWNEWCFKAMEGLTELAARHGITNSALAIGWVLASSQVAACVVGSKSVEQLESNLASFSTPIAPEVLEEATAIADELLHSGPWRGVVSQPQANAKRED